MRTKAPSLTVALDSLAPSGMRIDHRIISQGDENGLLPPEMTAFRTSVTKVRRQSGAARMVARELLRTFGFGEIALPRSVAGPTVWPSNIVGSLAHDDTVAIAAVARVQQFAVLGIDVEPAEPIPADLAAIVTTPNERRRYPSALIQSRLFFAIKEATYKALNPVDGLFLDFHDIEVDLEGNVCKTHHGRQLHVAFTMVPRVVALAFVTAPATATVLRPDSPFTGGPSMIGSD